MREKENRKVAVITGASSGIGAEFARALAARNYDLVLVARRRERLEQLAAEVSQQNGVGAEILAADLACDEDVARVASRIAGETRLGMLVNNAGFGLNGMFHETPQDGQDRMYRVHVLTVVRLTHAALPVLIQRNGGGIINVASVAGFTRMPAHASYASTKSWMIAFSECLHLEMISAGHNVRVQALCPGYTYTEFHDVLGMDRSAIMPSGKFWMTAAFVVDESLKAFDRRQWLAIPSWRYRMLVRFLENAPRALLYPIMIRVARRREAAKRS